MGSGKRGSWAEAFFYWLVILVLALPLAAEAAEWRGRVTSVLDGDSLVIHNGRKPVEVRLHAIDAPEHHQPYGEEAKALTARLCLHRKVRVIARGRDTYGRTLAEVMLADGRSLNQELVRAGAAWWYRRFAPHDKTLHRLQKEARSAKRGLWADPKAMPPWKWRQREHARHGRVMEFGRETDGGIPHGDVSAAAPLQKTVCRPWS